MFKFLREQEALRKQAEIVRKKEWDYMDNCCLKYGLLPPNVGQRDWHEQIANLIRLLDQKIEKQSVLIADLRRNLYEPTLEELMAEKRALEANRPPKAEKVKKGK